MKARLRDGVEQDPGFLPLVGDDIYVGVAIVVFLLLSYFVLIPVLFAVVEVLVLVLLGALGVLARVLLGRPWRIEAVANDGTLHTWDVVGWDASSAKIDEVATALASGIVPPADAG